MLHADGHAHVVGLNDAENLDADRSDQHIPEGAVVVRIAPDRRKKRCGGAPRALPRQPGKQPLGDAVRVIAEDQYGSHDTRQGGDRQREHHRPAGGEIAREREAQKRHQQHRQDAEHAVHHDRRH